MRSLLRTIWITSIVTAAAWIFLGYQAVDVPPDTLRSTSAVTVTETPTGIRFEPTARRNNSGLIFLPGAMVDPKAYTPLLKNLAAAGHSAYLQYLPARCALLEYQVNGLFDQISAFTAANGDTRWRLGGHSRGAMLAARFARESESGIAGLILIGTTEPGDFDISSLTIPVAKILGSRDGIATPVATRANARLLPRSTTWIEIPGANHVQFGYYRFQLFDGEPGISRAAQQAETLKAIRRTLGS